MQAFGRQLLGLFSRHVAASAGEEIGEGTRAVWASNPNWPCCSNWKN